MSLWQPPVGLRIAPGQLEGHRRAECDRCDYVGASTDRERAQAEAEAHVCDPRDVERTALRWDVLRRDVVAVPSEGGEPVYGRRGAGRHR